MEPSKAIKEAQDAGVDPDKLQALAGNDDWEGLFTLAQALKAQRIAVDVDITVPGLDPALLKPILERLKEHDMSLEKLKLEVAEQKSVNESVVTLVQGLRGEISALAAAGGATTAELEALANDIDANTNSLASGVQAGTVADPAAPTPDAANPAVPDPEPVVPPVDVIVNTDDAGTPSTDPVPVNP